MSHLTEGDAGDHKLAVHTARAPGELAAIANTLFSAVTRQRLKLHASLIAFFIGQLLINCLLSQLNTERELLCCHLLTLLVS